MVKKSKVVPVPKHHAMKTYGRVDVEPPALLTSAQDGGEWSASHLATLHPGKEPPVAIGEGTGWAPEPVWTRW